MDLIVIGQAKLRDLYQVQQEILYREEKQRQKLEEVLRTVNPNSTVETYTIHSDETGEKFLIQSKCSLKIYYQQIILSIL